MNSFAEEKSLWLGAYPLPHEGLGGEADAPNDESDSPTEVTRPRLTIDDDWREPVGAGASHTARVLARLERAIMDGRLKADHVYQLGWLAERFQVSRTPVREALLQLMER